MAAASAQMCARELCDEAAVDGEAILRKMIFSRWEVDDAGTLVRRAFSFLRLSDVLWGQTACSVRWITDLATVTRVRPVVSLQPEIVNFPFYVKLEDSLVPVGTWLSLMRIVIA